MSEEFLEKLKKQIPGCSVTLKDSTKRSDGEWHARWTFLVTDCNGKPLFESFWFGYKTAAEALDAMSGCLDYYMKTAQTKKDAKP
jgi:hypothetical protein